MASFSFTSPEDTLQRLRKQGAESATSIERPLGTNGTEVLEQSYENTSVTPVFALLKQQRDGQAKSVHAQKSECQKCQKAAKETSGTSGTLIPDASRQTHPLGDARLRLARYRSQCGPQDAATWLEHFSKAHAACVATFSETRQPYALQGYGASYCYGQTAQVIAAHTVALELWAQDKRVRPYGVFLEAACKACRLDVNSLPKNGVKA